MTPELTVLALAAVLQAIQLLIATLLVNRDAGLKWNTGPRDTVPQFSAITGRMRRAASNHFESLILMTLAVVVISLSGQNSPATAMAVWIYLLARVIYVPAYAFGWSPWRSVFWGIGFLSSLYIILASLL